MDLKQIDALLFQEMEEIKGGLTEGLVCSCTKGAGLGNGEGTCTCSSQAMVGVEKPSVDTCHCDTGAGNK